MNRIKPVCPRKWTLYLAALYASATSLLAASPLGATHAAARAVAAVQQKVTHPLMDQLPDILGTAVGLDTTDKAVLRVYVDVQGPTAAQIARAMPKEINGIPVEIELSEKFRAVGAKPTNPGQGQGQGRNVSHTRLQTGAIQMGTSGGWFFDMANGYCCGGTLGAVVQVGPKKYIISNYHVFEADITSGGNGRVAGAGDPVIQPGLIDVACSAAQAQVIGSLVPLKSLWPETAANVDVSVAEITSDRVSSSILEIGPISSQITAPLVGQAVRKSGRTTGMTRSSISALNATLRVFYDNECAGGVAFEKIFFGQIVVSNKQLKFLDAGDSGSLLVEDKNKNPRAVGLLYATSGTTAIANPIDEVLTFIGDHLGGPATLVGE